MVYTLHFSEETKLGKKRIDRFRNDAMAVVDGFKNGEFKPEDYEKKLKKGDNLIFTAFGAGFTYGAVYVKWGYDPKME